MKDSKGFIKLDRSIFEHWIFQDAEKFKAFVDLIQLARWKDEKILIGNNLVTIPRGSYYTSELKLADRWGWGRDKTRNFLSLLEKERMINKKSTTKGTILTIENYRVYQDEHPTVYTAKTQQTNNEPDNKPTTNQHQTNNEPDTKEEIKEIKEIKEREKREEIQPNSLPPLSFSSSIHKDIFNLIGKEGYRMWFEHAEITEHNDKIIIKAENVLKSGVIKNRYVDRISLHLNKKIEVI